MGERVKKLSLNWSFNLFFSGSSVIASEGGHGIVAPRKHFKHFNNDLIFQKIQAVCRLLGYFGMKPLLTFIQ